MDFWSDLSAYITRLLTRIPQTAWNFTASVSDNQKALMLFGQRADGYGHAVEIRFHDRFCLISISSLFFYTNERKATKFSAGDLTAVFDADIPFADETAFIDSVRLAIAKAESYGPEILRFARPKHTRRRRR